MRYLNYIGVALGVAVSLMSPVRAQNVVIGNVTLIDGTGAEPVPHAWVAVTGDRITGVGTGVPPKAQVNIDGAGRFLLPGLIDTHVHIGGGRLRPGEEGGGGMAARRQRAEQSLHGYLYSGVTTVYDSGNMPEFIFPLRDDTRSGAVLSPRLLATGGVVTVPGGYGSGPGATLIGGPEDLPSLKAYLDLAPDMVKILLDPQGRRGIPEAPIFTASLLADVVNLIHARGIRATVHIPAEAEARLAIEAGVDALAHLPARTAMSEDFAVYAADRKIPIATTLTVFSNIARVADTPEMFDSPLYRAVMPPDQRERQKTTERARYIESGMSSFFSRMLPGMQQRMMILHEAGVPLALGTDRSFGPTVHEELRLIVEAGVPPVEALKMAAVHAALYLGLSEDLGTVEVGKYADLILLRDDPTSDIRNSTSVDWVMSGGKIVDRTALDLPVNTIIP
jgi:imidazolonepropionase-like amidohydrolase